MVESSGGGCVRNASVFSSVAIVLRRIQSRFAIRSRHSVLPVLYRSRPVRVCLCDQEGRGNDDVEAHNRYHGTQMRVFSEDCWNLEDARPFVFSHPHDVATNDSPSR